MSVFNRSLTPLVIGLSILLGVVLLVVGFAQLDWKDVVSSFSVRESPGYFLFISGCAIAIFLLSKIFRVGLPGAIAFLALLVSVVANGMWPLLVTIGYFSASWSLGFLALKRFNLDDTALVHVTRVLVGSGLFATLISLLAHVKVNFPLVYILMLAVPMILLRVEILEVARKRRTLFFERSNEESGGLFEILSGALMLLYVAFAFLPEISHDPLAMHLFVPSYVQANHYWNFDPEFYVWTLMPMLADWSFSIGYMLSGESGSRLISVGFLFLGIFLVRDLVYRLGGSKRGAESATLILLSTPLTFLMGSSLYVEAFWSVYLVAGVSWAIQTIGPNQSSVTPISSSNLPLAGLLVGFAVAAKSVALVYAPIFALPVLTQIRLLTFPEIWRSIGKAMVLFVAAGFLPYAVSYFISGNPVFPFFNEIFHSPFFPQKNFNNLAFRQELDWTLPFSIAFSENKYIQGRMGGAGFHWITLGPLIAAILLLRRCDRRAVILTAISVLSLLAVFQFQSQLRYVYPVFLLTGALIGWAVSWVWRFHRPSFIGLFSVVSAIVLINLVFFGSVAERYFSVPVLALFDLEGFEKLEQRLAPGRQAVNLVNAVNRSGSPVAVLSSPVGAGLESDALYLNWYNRKFMNRIHESKDMNSFVEVLRDYGVRFVIFDANWKRTPASVRDYIDASTILLGTFEPVSVHRVRKESFFHYELLHDSRQFDQASWLVRPGAKLANEGIVSVSQLSPISQRVRIVEKQSYQNSVEARCGKRPGIGRLQVNWTDRGGRLLRSDVRRFACEESWTMESQEVTAPEGATFASIYGTSHTEVPIEIAGLSFKSPRKPVDLMQ